MAGVKDGIWKRGNNWYISVKVNGRRRVKSFGRDRKAAELTLANSSLRKAGLRHRPSYQLRHTFASLCLQSGIAPGWLANVLGHSTLQTTFKHYTRFIKDTSRENEDRLEQLLSPLPSRKAK